MKIIKYPLYNEHERPNSQDPYSLFKYIQEAEKAESTAQGIYTSARIRYEPDGIEEQILSEVPEVSVLYAMFYIKGPFTLAEPSIAKIPHLAVAYSRVIEGRFNKGENAILGDPKATQQYEAYLTSIGAELDQEYHRAKATKQQILQIMNVEIGNLLKKHQIDVSDLIYAAGRYTQ